jgi:hypothetical protein
LPLYTFYPTRHDGASPTFEAHELACDDTALNRAAEILKHHGSCDTVAVWDGDRQVGVHQGARVLKMA